MFDPNDYDDELIEIKTGHIEYNDHGPYFPDFEVYYDGGLVDIEKHYHFVIGQMEDLLEKMKTESEEAELEARRPE